MRRTYAIVPASEAGPAVACECHGEPMRWHANWQVPAGGTWRCAVRAREVKQQRYRADPTRTLEHNRRWRQANLETARELDRRYRATNPEKVRARDREYNATKAHGITRKQRDELYAAQDGRCAGCLSPFPDASLEIDHDHKCCPGRVSSCGQCVRGLVCHLCNVLEALDPDRRAWIPLRSDAAPSFMTGDRP